MMYRDLSPIRSHSPGPKPKIIFNYNPSPIRERQIQSNRLSNLNPNQHKSFVQNIHQKTYSPVKVPQNHKFNYQIRPNQYHQQRPSFANENTNINIHNVYRLCPQKVNTKTIPVQTKQGRNSIRRVTIQQNVLKQRQMNQLNKIPSSKVLQSNSIKPQYKTKQQQLQIFLFKLTQESHNLKSLLNNLNQQSLHQQIKIYYKELKLKLKKHYQTIKQSIKISIEKDLLELQNQQKQIIKYIQCSNSNIQQNIKEIKTIINDIEPFKIQILTMIDQQPFKDMLYQHKHHFARIQQQKVKIQKIIDEIYKDNAENNVLSSYFQGFKKEKSIIEKNVLYVPQHYIMFDAKGKKQICFSFDNEKND